MVAGGTEGVIILSGAEGATLGFTAGGGTSAIPGAIRVAGTSFLLVGGAFEIGVLIGSAIWAAAPPVNSWIRVEDHTFIEGY